MRERIAVWQTRSFGTLIYHAPNRRHPSVNLPMAVTAAMLSRVPCPCNRYRAINLTTLFVYCTVTVRGRAASALPAGSRYREKGSGRAGIGCPCNRYRAINLTTLFVYCTVTVRGRAASALPAGSRYREKGSGRAGIGILLDDSVRVASGAAGGAVEESGI